MTPLIETLLLGSATVLLFGYGAGQRHLKKKIASELELERTKNANALARHEEHLASLQAEIAKAQESLRTIEKQKAKETAEHDAIKEQKQALQKYLATKDGRAENQAALEKLAQVQGEIQTLIEKRNDISALKKGEVIASAPFASGMDVPATLRILQPECERVWKLAPGTVLAIDGADGKWKGSTVAALKSYIDSYKGRIWVDKGAAILRVSS